MRKRLKWVLLTVAGLVLMLVLVTVGAAVYWVKSNEDEMRALTLAAMQEGAAFGRGKQAEACLQEAIAREETCDQETSTSGLGFCVMGMEVFMLECAAHSEIPGDFCAGVPNAELKEVSSIARWMDEQCSSHREEVAVRRCRARADFLLDVCNTMKREGRIQAPPARRTAPPWTE